MAAANLVQNGGILTLDLLLDALTADDLAGLLSHKRLGNLAKFNGRPVIYSIIDSMAYGRVDEISGEMIRWEGDYGLVTGTGSNSVVYSEFDQTVTAFRGSPVKYVVDEGTHEVVGLERLNGKRVRFDGIGRITEINGHLANGSSLNGHPIKYSARGNIVHINGNPIVCRPGIRPCNDNILLLAALFPPYLLEERQHRQVA